MLMNVETAVPMSSPFSSTVTFRSPRLNSVGFPIEIVSTEPSNQNN